MIKINALIINILFLSLLLLACDDNKDNTNNKDSTENYFNNKNSSLVKFNGKIFNIPSPTQMAILTKEISLPLNKDVLNSTENYHLYNTNYKQALNIGAYGSDLAYLNIYEQFNETTKYISIIKKMANNLEIFNSLTNNTIKRLEQNSNNKDSILYILSTVYRDIDIYLVDNNRNNISVLIIAGGWIESIYITTQILQHDKKHAVIDRIGEQKYVLDNLIELLRPFYLQENENFDNLIETLAELQTIFEAINTEYIYNETITDEKNKITYINSTTNIVISEANLNKIIQKVEKIRNRMVE